MKFEEKEYINLTNIPKTFIYFLIYEKDVVYVGQTTNGLARVYSHSRTKKFNEIYVISCDEKSLNNLENKYILKYTPYYNKQLNDCSLSLKVVCKKLEVYDGSIRLPKLKKLLKKLNIVPFDYRGVFYIDEMDFDVILQYLLHGGC